MQGSTNADALKQYAGAITQAGQQAQNQAAFRPVGTTTTFGTSNFQIDPTAGGKIDFYQGSKMEPGSSPTFSDVYANLRKDPNLYSLDMFSPDELLNIGSSSFVSYYGYDPYGNKTSKVRQTF